MISSRVVGIWAAAMLLTACGSHEARSGANSAESHAPGTTLAKTAGDCASYTPGTPGVIQTFCSGHATLKVVVAGKEHDLTGGTCATQPMFSVNFGVVSNSALGGPKPDYFGMAVPSGVGHFSNAVINVTVDGKGYAVMKNSGDVSAAGGSFSGTSLMDSAPISGTFGC